MAELMDLVVTEVSLVDRPATGRRFRIVKGEGTPEVAGDPSSSVTSEEAPVSALTRVLKALLARAARPAEGASAPGHGPTPDGRGSQEEEGAVPVDTEGAVALTKALERLETLEAALADVRQRMEAEPARRHSELAEPASGRSLWKGVL